jgi:hypothetical protein
MRKAIRRLPEILVPDCAGSWSATLEQLDDGGKERLDAFRVRFADLQDLLASKVFRSLLLLEEEQPVSQLDVLNAIEKRGIAPSFYEWKRLREARNAFMHDDPEHSNESAEALTLAVDGARALLAVLRRTEDDANARIGLRVPQDRPPR